MMTANKYQKLAMRTYDGNASSRLGWAMSISKVKDVSEFDGKDIGGIMNSCLGLSGEVGELNDMIKKWIFHEKSLDEDELCKELGDILWYIAMFCESMNWDMEEVMEQNIEKLKRRYPEGFDIERANNREEQMLISEKEDYQSEGAGIFVRGMKMPQNCLKCPLQFGGFCGVQPDDVEDSRVAPTIDEAAEQGKPAWCPLENE